jgi:hypothetical protein
MSLEILKIIGPTEPEKTAANQGRLKTLVDFFKENKGKAQKVLRVGTAIIGLSTGVAGMAPQKASAEALQSRDHAIAYTIQKELSPEDQAFIVEADKKFSVDDLGLRISNPYIGPDGMKYIAYQGGIVQKNPKLGIVVWNSLDELHKMGLDAYLEAIYQIPPHEDFDDHSGGDTEVAFKRRTEYFGVLPAFVDWYQEKRKRFETGVFTSHVKTYPGFMAVRAQRYVGQLYTEGPKKGMIERILVGDIVKNVGRTIDGKTIPGPKIIPDEALLPQPVERMSVNLSFPCPVPDKLACQTPRIIEDGDIYALGFKLPEGTQIRAVFSGTLSDFPRPKEASPDHVFVNIGNNQGYDAKYSFYGTLTVPPNKDGRIYTYIKEGDVIGTIGKGMFPSIPPYNDLNFVFYLKKWTEYFKITPNNFRE